MIWGGAGMRGKWCYHLKYFTWLHDMGWSGDEGEVVLPPQIFHLVTWYGVGGGWGGSDFTAKNISLGYLAWGRYEGKWLYRVKYFTWLYGVGRGWGGRGLITSNISLGYMIWGGAGMRGRDFTASNISLGYLGWGGYEGEWLYRVKYFTWLYGVGMGLKGTWLNHLKYFTWLHDMGWSGDEGEVVLPPQIFHLVTWYGVERGWGGSYRLKYFTWTWYGVELYRLKYFTWLHEWGGAGMRGKWCYHLKYFTWLHDMGWSGDEGEVVLPPQIFHLVTWYGVERGWGGSGVTTSNISLGYMIWGGAGMRGNWCYHLKYFTWLHDMGWSGDEGEVVLPPQIFHLVTWYGVGGGWGGSDFTASNISLGYLGWGRYEGKWLYRVKYFTWLYGVGRGWGGRGLITSNTSLGYMIWGGAGMRGTLPPISLGYMIWGGAGMRGRDFTASNISLGYMNGVERGWGGSGVTTSNISLGYMIWGGAGMRGKWCYHLKYFTWLHDMGRSGDEGTWLYSLKYFTWLHEWGGAGMRGKWCYHLKYFTWLHDMGWSGDEGEVVLPPQIFHLVTWYGAERGWGDVTLPPQIFHLVTWGGAGMRGNGFTASNISLGYMGWGVGWVGRGLITSNISLGYMIWGGAGDEGEVVLPPQIFHLVTWYGVERGWGDVAHPLDIIVKNNGY